MCGNVLAYVDSGSQSLQIELSIVVERILSSYRGEVSMFRLPEDESVHPS